MKKNRSWQYLLLSGIITLAILWFLNDNSPIPKIHTKSLKNLATTQRNPAGTKNTDSRPRKDKSSPQSNLSRRIPKTNVVKKSNATLTPLNKIDSNWKIKAITRIKNNLEETSKVEILEAAPFIYQKHKIAFHTHKIKVRITREDGLVSSYMAMVNSSTGSIMQTWNQTHFEIKDKLFANQEARVLIPAE